MYCFLRPENGPESRKSFADRADIQWSGFLATNLTQYLSQRDSKRPFFNGELFFPLKTRITHQSLSDSASWRIVQESQVTVHSHSTAPIRRSPRIAELLSCSQFKDLGLIWRDKIKGLRNRIMQKRLRYYINNCLLSNPKGRAIKALTSTNRGQNQLAFRSVLRPSSVLFFRFVFYFLQYYSRAYSPENHASKSSFEYILI